MIKLKENGSLIDLTDVRLVERSKGDFDRANVKSGIIITYKDGGTIHLAYGTDDRYHGWATEAEKKRDLDFKQIEDVLVKEIVKGVL